MLSRIVRDSQNKRSRGFDGFAYDNESVNMATSNAKKPGSKKKAALDSGATSHLLPKETVGTAKSGSHISAIGRVDIGRIQNAIVVDEGIIEKPLVSVSKLDQAGYETTFKNGKGTIKDSNGNVVLEAPLEDDLSDVGPLGSADLWHRRLGHTAKICSQIKSRHSTLSEGSWGSSRMRH